MYLEIGLTLLGLAVALMWICFAVPDARGEVDPWEDFPTARTIEFGGYAWRVKGSEDPAVTMGPGRFPFGPTEPSVWVDEQGRLHLRVIEKDGVWYSAEVRLTEFLGHGDYRFTTVGRVDEVDPHLIFGLFLWEYQADYTGSETRNVANEFDIEFGNWDDPKRAPAQFVCQPWQTADNLHPYWFDLEDDAARSTHAFRWRPDAMDCRAWRGGPEAENDSEARLTTWTYDGPDVPRGAPQVHLNLWCNRQPPERGTPQEVIIEKFEFVPWQP
ncbi:MAG: hypothetical protein AAGF84_06300 [Planctomycetota bacterium]